MRRILVALAAGALLAGTVYGAAAGLGGITNNPDIGAEDTAVAGCDSDGIQVQYAVGHSFALNAEVLSAVLLRQLDDACRGQPIQLTVSVASGAVYFASGVVATGNPGDNLTSVSVPVAIKVKDFTDLHVVIGAVA